ncbi:glycosyl hydrolase [Croceibacterium ferulae]|uniref:glycosyl hydrolase n=1 Tax=Croceibacterium ferulae TaxID=1854641 RepID=UPI0019D4D188|nr:glycosyl hydrolase [Croceibacterium ferulae]
MPHIRPGRAVRRTAQVMAALCCLAGTTVLHAQSAADGGELWQGFSEPPAEARPMMRWWWFGPAVAPGEIDRELRAMKAGGIGGVEIQPVYPMQLDHAAQDAANQRYLSPEFLANLRHAADTARAEGLRVDVTGGSGWPYGGPHIPVDRASAEIRLVRVPVAAGQNAVILPDVNAGERILSAMIGPVAEKTAARPLAPLAHEGARADLTSADEPREALVFIAGRTGQQVKRPGIGGEGFVLDHMDPDALRLHLAEVVTPLLSAFAGTKPPHALFSDSLEVYGGSWTPDLPAEFANRRGYDLLDHLPDLFLDTPDSGAVRHDWALTLSELVDERYLAPLSEWAREHGTQVRAQVYGYPPATLSSNALIALPEGEGEDWRDFNSTRWATSAAHLYDKPVVSSETWTWLHSPSWAATPLDMKMEADRHFLQGVTQLIGHGWPYSPPGEAEPGWSFYAAAALNDHNPWYPVMADVSRYLARTSWMLRQGAPANGVALYLPIEDAFAAMVPARPSANVKVGELLPDTLVSDILDSGHGLDFVDRGVLQGRTLPHRVLLLPHLQRIDADAFRKIEQWVGSGGRLLAIGDLPETAGGLHAEEDSAAVQAISRRLLASGAVTVIDPAEVTPALRAAATPDVTLAMPDPDIGFIRRNTADRDIFFIVNSGNQPVHTSARIASRFAAGEWWDPMTGRRWPAGGGDAVELTLAPYQSRFLIFSEEAGPVQAVGVPERRQPLAGGWTLSIDGRQIAEDVWRDWATRDGLQYFSGIGTYRTELPIAGLDPQACYVLDFGEARPAPAPPRARHQAELAAPVRDAAIVSVNGARVGSAWAPPYRLDITAALRDGANRIEIDVANTMMNHLAGQPRTDHRLLHARYGERFQPQDQDSIAPQPSGLLQAVDLITVPADAGTCGR